MTTKLAKWASEHDQIIKSRLSYGHQAKSLPSEAGLAYDWLRFNGYLGNVGLYKCTPEWVIPVAPNTSDQMA